jgi:hypothetical protein
MHGLAWLGLALVTRHRGVTKEKNSSESCEKLTSISVLKYLSTEMSDEVL